MKLFAACPAIFRVFIRLAAVVFVCFLQGCLERDFPEGTAAEVDGEAISFDELEAARAGLFSVNDPAAAPYDDAELHRQYRHTLRGLIEERVICRFMAKKGLTLAPGQLEAEEERILADYPDGAFDDMLVNEGIIYDDWRKALERRLITELFLDQVLRPEISISPEQVQDYYVKHSREFLIPEQWHFLHIAGQEQAVVQEALKRLLAGEDAAVVQNDLLVSIHDVLMAVDMLPEDIRKTLAPLLPVSATKASRNANGFAAQVLLEKIPSSVLDPAEISRRVERVLVEEKMQDVYAAWIEKRLSKVQIHIAPALSEETAPQAAAPPPAARPFAP